MGETDYARIYRAAHPKQMPYSSHEPQRELSNLWPVDQQAFRDLVDAVLKDPNNG